MKQLIFTEYEQIKISLRMFTFGELFLNEAEWVDKRPIDRVIRQPYC